MVNNNKPSLKQNKIYLLLWPVKCYLDFSIRLKEDTYDISSVVKFTEFAKANAFLILFILMMIDIKSIDSTI